MTPKSTIQLEGVKLMLQAEASKCYTSMLLPRLTTITSAFPISPHDVKGIQVLDNKLTAIGNQAMTLPRSLPNGMGLVLKKGQEWV